MYRKSQGIFNSFFCFVQVVLADNISTFFSELFGRGGLFVCLIASCLSFQALPFQGAWVSAVSVIQTPT